VCDALNPLRRAIIALLRNDTFRGLRHDAGCDLS